MRDRFALNLTTDGELTVADHGRFLLRPGRASGHLSAANAKLSELGLDLDYAWFDSLDGGYYGHAVPHGAPTGVWD